jgi:1,4-alpha-glucan branching enzyme
MKYFISILCFFCVINFSSAQSLLSWSPSFLSEVNSSPVVITADATKGNNGLLNYTPTSDVYVHIGAITNLSTGPGNWLYVNSAWGTTTPAYNAPSVGANQWQFTLPANLRTYFGITNPAEKIIRISILFRSGNGNAKLANSDGSDMYIPVDTTGNLQVKFVQPPTEPRYTPWVEPITINVGQPLPVQAASSTNSDLEIFLNGVSIGTQINVSSLLANPTIAAPCANQLVAKAVSGATTVYDTINFFVPQVSSVAALPAGLQDGINYYSNNTEATFVLYAPGKSNVAIVTDQNNWVQTCNSAMNITPDGTRFWKTLTGLTPGQIYKFQYLVDNSIITTDPYTELILDPNNDAAITAATYPNKPSYPVGRTGYVGTFKTGATPYVWTSTNYVRPAKKDLRIYEVLLRDFIASHNYNGIADSLDYLKKLGINCIELMPIGEFEGNSSWGYNPNFYFAPDKYYGPATDLKKFIDKAHSKGIAVVVDAVLNHVTGTSPLAQMWWNGTTNKPSADNPYLNIDAKHDFNVFNDFNHESAATKYHVHRYIRHWLTEYKVDGFRWDLAKGFTQNNTLGNIGAFANYDPSRVAIWKNYYDSMQAVSPNSYCILELFAVDAEESEYANYGMLVWGNSNFNWIQNSNGYSSNSNIDRLYYMNRPGYTVPAVVGYAESHDEERLMYSALQNGNSAGAYNVKTLATALKRQEAVQAIFLSIPGPKQMWQFGELGYDQSINRCVNGTVNNNCRLDEKPILWNYYSIAGRKNVFNVVSKMNQLRELKPDAFNGATVSSGTDFGSNLVKRVVLNHSSLKMVSLANFGTTSSTFTHTFPSAGYWYNYLGTDSINATGGSQTIFLNPGDYKVYTNTKLGTNTSTGLWDVKENKQFAAMVYPNPTQGQASILIEPKVSGLLEVNIVDFTGKRIQRFTTNVNANKENAIPLGDSHFSAGVYYIQLKMNGESEFLPLTIIK